MSEEVGESLILCLTFAFAGKVTVDTAQVGASYG
jgi:hypothetical protein